MNDSKQETHILTDGLTEAMINTARICVEENRLFIVHPELFLQLAARASSHKPAPPEGYTEELLAMAREGNAQLSSPPSPPKAAPDFDLRKQLMNEFSITMEGGRYTCPAEPQPIEALTLLELVVKIANLRDFEGEKKAVDAALASIGGEVTWRLNADGKEWDFIYSEERARDAYTIASVGEAKGMYKRVILTKITTISEVVATRESQSRPEGSK